MRKGLMLAALPETRIEWTDPRLRGGGLAIAAAAIVAILFLPKSFTNNDEFYYAGQASTLAHGRLAPRAGDPLLVPLEPPALAFRYPIAWPAVLVPGRLASIRGLYVVALLVHLLGGAAVARMLVRRGASSALTAVYLFHPVFWIYSRTLLSDVPAVAALLVAMDAWENRSQKTAAAALGFAGAVRLANVTAVLGFGLAIVKEGRRRWRDVAALVGGVGIFWALQLLVNHALSGHWLASTYAQQGASMFDGHMAAENIGLYLGGLALLPPFPLLIVLARPRAVDRWALLAIPVIAAYVPVSFHNTSPSIAETLIGGQRYVMPAHAALLVATAGVWSKAPIVRRGWLPVAAGLLIAVAGCLAMKRLENRHRLAADGVSACRPNILAYNVFANRVAGSVQAKSYLLATEPPYRSTDWDVLVLAPSFQSNQPGFSSVWASAPPRIEGASCRRIGSYAIYDSSGRCPPQGLPCVADSARPSPDP